MSNILELKPELNTLHHFSRQHSLIEGSNFAKALRLLLIVKSIYADNSLELGTEFSHNDWRDQFFLTKKINKKDDKNYHKRDQKPELHDPHCRCAKNIRNWLFESNSSLDKDELKFSLDEDELKFNVDEDEWKNSFLKTYKIKYEDLERLLNEGDLITETEEKKKSNKLPNGRLFAVTGQILWGTIPSSHLNILVELGWLEKKGKNIYKKVQKFPTIQFDEDDLFDHFHQTYFDESLATTSDILKGQKRFFIKFQHIINQENIAKIGNIIEELRHIWQKEEIALIQIKYNSSSLQKQTELIVYPISLFYNQRCIYLVGYGSMPKNPTDLDYYNYRLDHICKNEQNQYINMLDWDENNLDIHLDLFNKKQNLLSQNSDYLSTEMEKALGVDIHREIKTMLLRFPEPFHQNYIEGSNRHETFKRLKFKKNENEQFFQELTRRCNKHKTEIKESDKKLIEKTIKTHPDDAYYTMNYRHGKEGGQNVEADVIMRLRAWCPNVEVLLPGDLRQRMKEDMKKTWELYQND